MKKNNYFIWIVLITLFISSVINMYQKKINDINFNKLLLCKFEIHQNRVIRNKLYNNIKLIYENSVFKIDPSLILKRENSENIKIENIKIEKYKLVYRYSDLACSDCINEEIEIIQHFEKKIGKENILFLSSYRNQRHLLANKKFNNIDFKIYNSIEGKIKNNMEVNNIPYLFVYDKNYKVSNVFIPSKYCPEMTEMYLQNIEKLFNESKDSNK